MSTHEQWLCMICRKNKVNVTVASDGSHDLPWGNNRPVCKNQECQDKMREKMKTHNEWLRKEEAKKISRQIQEIMDRGEKLTIDFEKYELTEELKELCRKYVKTGQNIEDLKKQKEKLREKQKEELKNLLKCDKCSKISSDGKCYEVGGEGNYCKDCARKIVNSHNKNNTYQSPTRQSPINDTKPCDRCGLTFLGEKYYTVGGKGHYCDNCANKLVEEPKKNQTHGSQGNNQNDNYSPEQKPSSSRPRKKYAVASFSDVKRQMREGYKMDDFDLSNLNLTYEQRKELEKLERDYSDDFDGLRSERPFFKTGLGLAVCVVGLILVFIGIILLIRRRRKKHKKRK